VGAGPPRQIVKESGFMVIAILTKRNLPQFLDRCPEPLHEGFVDHCRRAVETAEPVSDYHFMPDDGVVDVRATAEEIMWSLRRDYETQARCAAQRLDRECYEDAEAWQRATAELQPERLDYLAALWAEVRQ